MSTAYFTGARCLYCGEWRTIVGRTPVIAAVCPTCTARNAHRGLHAVPPPALAHGSVADTAEPVAAEAGRPIPEPDGDDTHTVGHEA